MLLSSSEPRTFEIQLGNLYDYRRKLQIYGLLTNELFVADQFPELPNYINSRYAQVDREICELATLSAYAARPATREDVEQIVQQESAYIKAKQDVALTSLAETNKIVKRSDNRAKNAQHKIKTQYSKERLDAIHAQWLKAQNHPSVKSDSSHRPSYEAALKYFKKEFNALGIYTPDQLRKALKAWSQRASRSK